MECGRLNYALKILVTCGAHKVPDSLVGNIPNPNVNWIIVRGKHVSEEDKLLLSEAVDIMHVSVAFVLHIKSVSLVYVECVLL